MESAEHVLFSAGMVPTNIVRVNMFAAAVSGLPSEEVTMAEMVKKKGYKSALIGKYPLSPVSPCL